jgi:hypothetical protein
MEGYSMALVSFIFLVIIGAIIVNFFVTFIADTVTFNKFRKYILIALWVFYPLYCLVQIKVSIRWGGDSQQSYTIGLWFAVISFIVPFMFSLIGARFVNNPAKENYTATLLRLLPHVLIVCSILLSIFYFFMLSIHF